MVIAAEESTARAPLYTRRDGKQSEKMLTTVDGGALLFPCMCMYQKGK